MRLAYFVACVICSAWLVAIFRPDSATRRECAIAVALLAAVAWCLGVLVAPGLR